jgi:inosine-uridine nucleoside N-ribohydrolase
MNSGRVKLSSPILIISLNAGLSITSGTVITLLALNANIRLDFAAIYLHDPATMVAAVDPSLMTYATGAVRVQQEGICRGLTLFNNTNKV